MEIIKTTDFELVAKLNQSVHDLHSRLYPEYFKEYNFERIRDFFEKIINQPEYIFLLLMDDEQYIG